LNHAKFFEIKEIGYAGDLAQLSFTTNSDPSANCNLNIHTTKVGLVVSVLLSHRLRIIQQFIKERSCHGSMSEEGGWFVDFTQVPNQ
jgi:hypothetical protein